MTIRLKRLDGDDSNERYIQVYLSKKMRKGANPEEEEFSG